MNHINIKQLGFAVGSTIVIIYIGCIAVISIISTEEAIAFFNNLMHFIDATTIIRKTPMSFFEIIIGIVEWFIIGWLIGASIASISNLGNKTNKP